MRFFFNDTATTEIYTLSLHDALPILPEGAAAYEADKWVLSEVIGFRLTRGVLASADRRPPADLDALLAGPDPAAPRRLAVLRSEEHTSELQSRQYLVCRLLLEKKKTH